jgi:hypothetical protein
MDLYKTIQELYAEKATLDRVIAALERLQGTAAVLSPLPKHGKRRGRKSICREERLEGSVNGEPLETR